MTHFIRDIGDETGEQVLREVKSLLKVKFSEYVVHYVNSWSDGRHLFIQMEFCAHSLRNIYRRQS